MAQKVDTHMLQAQRLFSVDGWVCLVTGGGSGIGLMCAQALAANGAKVYITGRSMDKLRTAAKEHSPKEGKGSIVPIGPCDVTSKSDLNSLYKTLTNKETHLNLLVCNAGIAGPKSGTPQSTDAARLRSQLWDKENERDWSAVFDTNVTSIYFTTVAFLPLLQAAAHVDGSGAKHANAGAGDNGAVKPLTAPAPNLSAGSVVVISSMSGIMRGSQGHFSYNASKGAAVHLAKMLSSELEGVGIRVNSIAPGYFPSEMTAKESDDRNKSELPDDKVRDKGHPVPAGRAGSDEEMAQAILLLAKNRYINGEILAVDGGVLNNIAGR